MNDNIVEVISGIFGEIQPARCTISSLVKNSRVYAQKIIGINGEGKPLSIHSLVLENSLGRSIKPEFFARATRDVGKGINSNYWWQGFRFTKNQNRLTKEGVKNVESTSATKHQKKLRSREVITSIRGEIQPKGCITFVPGLKEVMVTRLKVLKLIAKQKVFIATDLYLKINWED